MNPLGGDPGASLTSGGLTLLLDKGDRWLQRHSEPFPVPASLLPTSRGLLLALIGLLLLLFLPPLIGSLLRRYRRMEPNFRGETIPLSYGLVILLWAGIVVALEGWLVPSLRPERIRWLICILGFGALGFIDDLWGTKKIKGLRGHFRAAFQERTITTGFVKAIGGTLLACWLGWSLHPADYPAAFLSAAVIALSANAINLLDLRPGRAGGVFLLLAALLIAARFLTDGSSGGIPPLLYVTLPALVVWQKDASAQVMMGDTGSNLLGASLGITIAAFQNSGITCLTILLLIALHLIAERISLTRLIENTPWLRALDRLTGVR